ncbi:MAG TPA: hypothetical protein VMM37_09860 [Bacteroidota bacterium]|nr:hypothetical protein [Bacteroidota bacterium]
MTRNLFLLVPLFVSVGLAQTDSASTPLRPLFAPRIRTVAVEASTYWFYYKGFGGTVDVDMFHYADTTATGVGFRLGYQEYRKGAAFSFDQRATQVVTIGRSALFRVTLGIGDTRSDALIGASKGDPQLGSMDSQVVFGIDMRAILVKPLAAIFGRVMGSRNGLWIQFGVSVGYMN